MATYTFRFLSHGKALGAARYQFADDAGALRMARRLSDDLAIEIWCEDRFAARVKRAGASSRFSDAGAAPPAASVRSWFSQTQPAPAHESQPVAPIR